MKWRSQFKWSLQTCTIMRWNGLANSVLIRRARLMSIVKAITERRKQYKMEEKRERMSLLRMKIKNICSQLYTSYYEMDISTSDRLMHNCHMAWLQEGQVAIMHECQSDKHILYSFMNHSGSMLVFQSWTYFWPIVNVDVLAFFFLLTTHITTVALGIWLWNMIWLISWHLLL